MKRIVLTSLCLFVMGCSNADGIDGQYQRSNATPFEAKYGMAKGLLIEDDGQRVTLQHSWGGDVLDIKREDGRLVVLDDGEPEYVITFQNGKAVISNFDTEYPTNHYEFVREGRE